MTDDPVGDLPTVSFVVPTYRRPATLRITVAALLRVDYPPEHFEVVVVDDGSGDETRDVVADLGRGPGARLVYLEQPNSGAATARNRGARAATGDLLIFVDDDIVVEPSHIHDHLAVPGSRSDTLVNGHWEFPETLELALAGTPFGRFRLEVEAWVKEGVSKVPLPDGRLEPSAVTACNLGIPRAVFWKLDGFDETFPFAGYEDQELSYRAVEAGFRLVYDRRIRLIHNDQRLTLQQFCERQRRGACTAVHLAARHPEAFARRPLILENGPITRSDPRRTAVKKVLKRAMATPPALAGVHVGVKFLERVAPDSRLLRRAYWSVCGLYIFQGVRDGFGAVGPPGRTLAPAAP
jgi:GT2 family glycosyltransferase